MRLHGASHDVIADVAKRAFLCAVAATGGDITLRNVRTDILDSALDKLRAMGLTMTFGADWIRAEMSARPNPVSFRTTEYPGFPTDMQAQFMAVNTIANGASRVTETIFENRFMHVQEMNRLGATHHRGNTAIIAGVKQAARARDGDRPARVGVAVIAALAAMAKR